ncbi:deoxyribonuclease IV [symbiont of Argiope bruennichi]|uniref:deoxyribonuclease IV n=1 Tax=symbiont of Argiope bruennichi TaxID=2810479 RepID=UPI003DA59219
MYQLLIGSHCQLKAPNYFFGSVKEAIEYKANALMIYTGAPQNTIRKPTAFFKIKEAKELLEKANIPLENVVVHCPYIINVSNPIDKIKKQFSVNFLEEEIKRTAAIGAKTLVLHPGNYLSSDLFSGILNCIDSLNQIDLKKYQVKIALETMAGKGTEICFRFEHLKYILDHVNDKENIGVCLDSCHLHDSGYDIINNLDAVLEHFDNLIGIEKIFCIHVNDSKNLQNSRKDRHENIGCGCIGFKPLINFIFHIKLNNIVKILETPYINNVPMYREEIDIIRKKTFVNLKESHYEN